MEGCADGRERRRREIAPSVPVGAGDFLVAASEATFKTDNQISYRTHFLRTVNVIFFPFPFHNRL